MDDFLKQIYPKDKERWIKVKYTDPDKAARTIRLNTPFAELKDLGFEVISIGIRDEYTPQLEYLLELKAEANNNMSFLQYPETLEHLNNMIDRKIDMMLTEITLSKQ